MSWSDLFKKKNISLTVEAFNDHGIISLANEALKEDPDNLLVKTIKDNLTQNTPKKDLNRPT